MEIDGALVRELREAEGYTLSELADHAGMYKSELSEIENGIRGPMFGLTHLQSIGLVLGCDWTEFIV